MTTWFEIWQEDKTSGEVKKVGMTPDEAFAKECAAGYHFQVGKTHYVWIDVVEEEEG